MENNNDASAMTTNNDDQNDDNANDEHFLGLVDTPTEPTTIFHNMELSSTPTTDNRIPQHQQ